MVNPDGANICIQGQSDWKSNANGVDLNDQFPAGWLVEKNRRQVSCPGPQDFAGDLPLSEPEAQALVRLVRTSDYESVMSVHSQGEEIYWNYRGLEPEHASGWAKQLAEVSAYTSVELSNSDAGFKDWFIQEYARPGFTIEVGMGRNPLPLSDFPAICERFRLLLKKYVLLNCEC
jgi:g-D-glutamyl-meso-diaminopimelate peptidase